MNIEQRAVGIEDKRLCCSHRLSPLGRLPARPLLCPLPVTMSGSFENDRVTAAPLYVASAPLQGRPFVVATHRIIAARCPCLSNDPCSDLDSAPGSRRTRSYSCGLVSQIVGPKNLSQGCSSELS